MGTRLPNKLLLACACACACSLPIVAANSTPQPALLWNMSATTEVLTYDAGITAFAAQGLANRFDNSTGNNNSDSTLVFFDIGDMNYDWPHADRYWRNTLQAQGRASFDVIGPSLCDLLEHSSVARALNGLVVYAGDLDFSASGPFRRQYGDGYSAAIALTLAGQQRLLPVSASVLARHGRCMGPGTALPVRMDLRSTLASKTRLQVWEWAISTLLPKSSKNVVFNLNHFRVRGDPLQFQFDKQSNATASSIDYIVQQNAFVLDLESHSSNASKGGTAPRNADDALIERVFSYMDPLFDAYGWAEDEFSWTNVTSHFGGTIACSFASPNLSFWSRLRLTAGATRARKLPENDRGTVLDRSKYYVTFETNEGDTPRILVSAMASAWAQPERGSLPVAWAIDPLLAERFPSLFDHFAATATANDSFIAGTAGAGYAFLNQMSAQQLHAYGSRVGSLTAKYGPRVLDTYGYANVSVHQAYMRAAAAAGSAPAAFVTQPNWVNAVGSPAYDPFHCQPDGANLLISNTAAGVDAVGTPNSSRTPLICATGDPKLFYYSSGLNSMCPSCDLAKRIDTAARRFSPPHFVLVYGGLQAFGGSEKRTKKSFYTLLTDTIARLGDDFVTVGASDMARLARVAAQND